jgi:hypothetical protein
LPNLIPKHTLIVHHGNEYKAFKIDGNLTVNGHFFISISDIYNPLYITGNLIVNGDLIIGSETFLFVEGKTTVRHLIHSLSDGGYANFIGDIDSESIVSLSETSNIYKGKKSIKSKGKLLKEYEEKSGFELFELLKQGEKIFK